MVKFDVAYPVLWIWASGLLFALMHSVLASRVCKAGWYAIGLSSRAYRLIYSVIALLITTVWLGFVYLLPDQPLYQIEGPGRWAMHAVQLLGAGVFMAALAPINTGAFLGLTPFPEDDEPFIEQGIYRHLRHPMYSGIMLVMFAWPEQSMNSLNLFLCISTYFVIGSKFEEARMLVGHPDYADYLKHVPAFIPGLRSGR